MVRFSVVVPCYNSDVSLLTLVAKLKDVFDQLRESYEIILVNDGSVNPNTWKTIQELSDNPDNRVIGVNLFRNFGQQSATICGFTYCNSEYVITMDDDLQHNPLDLPKLLSKRDHDVVIGRIVNRKSSLNNKFTSWLKSHFDHIVFGKPKHIRLSPYRLIKSDVLKHMLEIRTPSPFVPALMFYVTKDVVNVEVQHESRIEGKTNYTFASRLKLFSLIIINNSSVVLKWIGYLGIMALLLSLSLLMYYFLAKMFFTTPPKGWTSLFSAILFFGGLSLFGIGLIGEYMIRMIPIVENKKAFIVREVIGTRE